MDRSEVRQSALAAMEAIKVNESERTADHRQTLLQWVGSVPFFKKNAPNEAAQVEICKDLDLVSYRNGEDIVVQGERGDAFFAVLLGEVDVIVNDVVVGQLTVPQCFGDRALEGDGKGGDQGVRTATIRAAGNVTVARLQ